MGKGVDVSETYGVIRAGSPQPIIISCEGPVEEVEGRDWSMLSVRWCEIERT
jgi:hypothetical protein